MFADLLRIDTTAEVQVSVEEMHLFNGLHAVAEKRHLRSQIHVDK